MYVANPVWTKGHRPPRISGTEFCICNCICRFLSESFLLCGRLCKIYSHVPWLFSLKALCSKTSHVSGIKFNLLVRFHIAATKMVHLNYPQVSCGITFAYWLFWSRNHFKTVSNHAGGCKKHQYFKNIWAKNSFCTLLCRLLVNIAAGLTKLLSRERNLFRCIKMLQEPPWKQLLQWHMGFFQAFGNNNKMLFKASCVAIRQLFKLFWSQSSKLDAISAAALSFRFLEMLKLVCHWNSTQIKGWYDPCYVILWWFIRGAHNLQQVLQSDISVETRVAEFSLITCLFRMFVWMAKSYSVISISCTIFRSFG